MRKTIVIIAFISLFSSIIMMTSWTFFTEILKNILGLSVFIAITTVAIIEFIPERTRKK